MANRKHSLFKGFGSTGFKRGGNYKQFKAWRKTRDKGMPGVYW